jgi:hypothetical protein
MCAVSNDLDALAQILDRGIGIGIVLRLVGLFRNGVMDLQGLDVEQLPAGTRVVGSVRSKIL